MQRCQNEVAGLGERECEGDRFGIAHFPYHHHIGILPENVTEGLGEGAEIIAELALAYDPLAVIEEEFDWQ